ncbi:MAG: choice-of-anchor V domain-containing protein [Bacteroidota bacterium]|nr:choice-of-anchor V domain-containing protein [Bacteroidota bacterium]
MKKIYFVILPFITLFIFCTAFVSMKYHGKNSTGIVGQTGSPGEGTCSGCHFGGSNATTVTINTVPSFTNSEFVQGQTYTITITVAGTAYNTFAFACEILQTSNNTNAGLMQNPGSGVKLQTAGNGRRNALQTTPKAGIGTADFTFEWLAPLNSNTVRFYAIGNCVNANGNTGGDFARAISLTLTTPTVTAIDEQKEVSINGLSVYPNPAMDNINVSYGLSNLKQVNIQLCSITGAVVAQLLDEKQDNGLHSKNLKIPSSVASGMYFLKVMADNKIVAQRLVSIR